MTSHNTEAPVRFRLPLLAAALVGAVLLGASPVHAQQADVVRGRVIGPDSVPIEGAQVTVTSLNGNVSRATRSNKDGRFTVAFPNGEGDYIVSFAALGFAVKRFEVKRMADEEILVADAKLTRAAVNLEAMKVTAPREKVARNDAQPDISGTERPVTNAALLDRNLPLADEPTIGAVVGGEFVYVANSQWEKYTDRGARKPERPLAAPVLLAVPLPR